MNLELLSFRVKMIVVFTTIWQQAYIFWMRCTTAIACHAIRTSIQSKENFTSTIGNAKVIGPHDLVQRLVRIVAELEKLSPDRYLILTTRQLVFYFAPAIATTTTRNRYAVIGKDYARNGDAALRAYVVWFSYKVEAKLHPIQNLLSDQYRKGVGIAKVFSQTTEWLKTHKEPDHIVQLFSVHETSSDTRR